MIKNETKTRSTSKLSEFIFNLQNKKAGSMLECPILITRGGVELTQEQYDTVKTYNNNPTSLNDPDYIVTVDLSKFIKSNYDGNISKFLLDVRYLDILAIPLYVYNYSTKSYTAYTQSTLYSLNNYIDSNCIMKFTFQKLSAFSLKLVSLNNINRRHSKIVANLDKTYSVLLQGINSLSDTSASYRRQLLKIETPIENNLTLVDFNYGIIPSNVTQVGDGVEIDSTTFLGEKVLKFKNSGKNSTTASISIPFTLTKVSNVNIEAYFSSEISYDKFTIYLDGVNVLYCSGSDLSSNLSGTYDTSSIASDCWFTYILKNISAGSHTIKLEYYKNSSGSSGLDNAFIRKITTDNGFDKLELFTANNTVILTRNGNDILTTSTLDINSCKYYDLLLTNSDGNIEIKVLQSNGIIVTNNVSSTATLLGNNSILRTLEIVDNCSPNSMFDALYVINKDLTISEKESILRGTQLGFKRPLVLTGAININTSYKLTGTATLYINDGVSRVVTGDFITTSYENNIVLDEDSICVRA